jgi:hypothetical protein
LANSVRIGPAAHDREAREIAMNPTSMRRALALSLLFVMGATTATGAPYLLVSGRWDNTLVVIDLAKAAEPGNDGTPNAIVNRVRVTPDLAPGTPASGQPSTSRCRPIGASRTSSITPGRSRRRLPPISSTVMPERSPS